MCIRDRIESSVNGLQVLLCHGRNDDEVQAQAVQASATVLGSLGASVTLEWFDDLGHSTNLAEMRYANQWLHKTLSCAAVVQQPDAPHLPPQICDTTAHEAGVEDFGFLSRGSQKKLQGNLLFQQARYAEALHLYGLALKDAEFVLSCPSVHIQPDQVRVGLEMEAAAKLNQATCHLKLGGSARACLKAAAEVAGGISAIGGHHSLLLETLSVLEAIPTRLRDKARLRVVQAHIQLQDYHQAESLLRDALHVSPVARESRPAFELELKRLKRLAHRASSSERTRYAGMFAKLEKSGGYMTEQEEARIKREMEVEKQQFANLDRDHESLVSKAIPIGNVSSAEREQILGPGMEP
eukprot:TRINITY_DN40175_c0_g1_i1.p1 TRINITY_DN40175_c0_g1~~TRINITY_DN40175_c0_g1_i1.p1  ORF type:complete len:353 (+),score=80.68 TRINITY_DN40175_c0_g1_i1:172-1230(+)